jgi:hypothetical protein
MDDNSGPIPFGVRDDGSVLDGLNGDAFLASPAYPMDKETLARKAGDAEAKFGVDESEIDPNDLSEAGWSVLFAPAVDRKIKDALAPLLAQRKAQVGAQGDDGRLFKVFDGDYRPGESASDWITRHGASMRTVVPLQGVPYYVLIVASPADIPFEFQYELDLFWAVGRIWFDTADEFRQYADSVVKYETAATVQTSRQLAYFTTCNEGDVATNLLMNQVALPLLKGTDISKPIGQGRKQNFQVQSFLGDSAGKESLGRIMRGDIPNGRPALLFTGSHGKSSDIADPLMPEFRGALICQEWVRGIPATPDQVFAGADVSANAKIHGMIHFMFACYGVGWPRHDTYSRTASAAPRIAPGPGLARLPRKLLAHPEGGALAVLGHIDRAWGWSFESDNGTAQNGDFRMILNSLMAGNRIGQATDRFNTDWAALSAGIAETLQQMQSGERTLSGDNLKRFANQWVARDDARNYIVLGDPAVRLRTEDMAVLS